MLIRFFKSALPSRFLALLLIALAMRIPALLQNLPKPSANYLPIYPGIAFPLDISFPFQWLVALIMLLVTALIINFLSVRYGFSEKNSTLAAFFFILGSSVFPITQPLNIFVIMTFLAALFFGLTFKVQNTENEIRAAFDVGLGLGIIVIFYPEAILMMAFIWLALISYRVSHWRPYAVSLLGVVIPFAMLFAGFYLFGSPKGLLPAFYSRLIPVFGLIHFASLFNLITGGILGIMVAFSVMKIITFLRSMNVSIMQHTMTTLWGLLLIFLILTLFEAPAESAVLICVPASLILANYYGSLKKLKWANLFLIVFFVMVLANNYLFLFHAS